MDPATAKTLVSALLVTAIVIFSLFSFEMIATEVVRDLKAVRSRPGARRPGRAE